eukprot:832188-Prymnesium_polylepis.2
MKTTAYGPIPTTGGAQKGSVFSRLREWFTKHIQFERCGSSASRTSVSPSASVPNTIRVRGTTAEGMAVPQLRGREIEALDHGVMPSLSALRESAMCGAHWVRTVV